MKKLNQLPKELRQALFGVDVVHVTFLVGTIVAVNTATPGHPIIIAFGVCALGWTVFAGWIHGIVRKNVKGQLNP